MAYTTPTATAAMIPGLVLDTATGAIITQCITWADNEINATLAKRYSVADFASSIPPQIVSISQQIALGHYWAHGHRGNEKAVEKSKMILRPARADLKQIADGKMLLVDADGSTISRRSGHPGVMATTTDYTSTFAEDDPLKWKVDPAKKRDIASERD